MEKSNYFYAFEIDACHSINLFSGSLAEVEADILVSSDDNHLSAGGGVSRALAVAAGSEIRKECRVLVEKNPPRIGDVVRTSAGLLNARYIYHAITIDHNRQLFMDEGVLRQLVKNILQQATADNVKSIGMPAMGTGSAFFNLEHASEIIIDELLKGLTETTIERVTLSLIGGNAEKLFYQRLIQSKRGSVVTSMLRQREKDTIKKRILSFGLCGDSAMICSYSKTKTISSGVVGVVPSLLGEIGVAGLLGRAFSQTVQRNDCAKEIENTSSCAVVEQFPNLVNEDVLTNIEPNRPRLVDGLADIIIEHATTEDIEQELLRLPACRGFKGTIKQRLMEFLYLSENNYRIALGPALFTNKDLRRISEKLGVDAELVREQEQLVENILKALGFNLLIPPRGITHYIERISRLENSVNKMEYNEKTFNIVAIENGKIIEQVFKDLLRLYSYAFWGNGFEKELQDRKIITPRHDGNPIARMTIGSSRQAMEQLAAIVGRDNNLREKLLTMGRKPSDLYLGKVEGPGGEEVDLEDILKKATGLRNVVAHSDEEGKVTDVQNVRDCLDSVRLFLDICQRRGIYPAVLRYEGTYENRNGERFVHFLDELGELRKVRTDERIDPRRHYYCIATNNPVYIHPWR